jgi:hypothetical protein
MLIGISKDYFKDRELDRVFASSNPFNLSLHRVLLKYPRYRTGSSLRSGLAIYQVA